MPWENQEKPFADQQLNDAMRRLDRNGRALDADRSPIGGRQLWDFVLDSTPTNWLRCTGDVVKISQYPGLFKVIGLTYGGDLSAGLFALPTAADQIIKAK